MLMKKITKSQNRASCSEIYKHAHHPNGKPTKVFHLLTILAFIGFIFHAPLIKGQFMTGYPTPSDPSPLPISGIDWFTDNTRAHVTHVDRTPTTHDILYLDVVHSHGQSDWGAVSGQRAMLIQMKRSDGVAGGWFEELNVVGVDLMANPVEIHVSKYSYAFETEQGSPGNPSSRLQVLLIPRFNILTLNHAVVRCKPWDGYTGGVLCYSARQTKIHRSVITAEGCGFYPENITFGQGGSGGAGDNMYNNDGYLSPIPYSDYCLTPNPGTNGTSGTAGTPGDNEMNNRNPGTQVSPLVFTAYNYGAPNIFSNIAVMGSAGYTKGGFDAFKGGEGGSGAGHGGTGGASGHSTPIMGANGNHGDDGGKGGDAGRGARGGGIILIKTLNFWDDMGNSSDHQGMMNGWLNAAGQQGEHGKTGEMGGAPGAGGFGGQGSISDPNVWFSGGTGGSGEPGTPSDGGDGSLGGKGGTIFLYTNASSIPQPEFHFFGMAFTMNWVNLKSGSNGFGGQGAFRHIPFNPPFVQEPDGIDLSNDYERCNSGGGSAIQWYCNCDMAMYPFEAEYASASGVISGTDITWTAGNWQSVFDITKATLTTTHNIGAGIKYVCRFYERDQAEEVFLSLISNLETPQKQFPTLTGSDIVLPADKQIITTDHFEYKFSEIGGLPVMKYVSINAPIQDRFIFYEFPGTSTQSFKIDTTRCFAWHPYMDEDDLEFGKTGETLPEPVPDVDPTIHFNRNPSTLLVLPNDNIQEHNREWVSFMQHTDMFVIRDNDFNEEAVMQEPNQIKTIVVYDLLGREIYKVQTNLRQYTVNTNNFAKGTYLVTITKEGNVSSYKLIVN